MTQEQLRQIQEIARCRNGAEGCIHFIRQYCQIEDPQRIGETWFRFELWPEQEDVVRAVFENQKVVAPKARQLGLTWLGIGIGLWFMLFQQGAKIGLVSARDKEASVLLRDRMKGMYRKLPEWMKSRVGAIDNDHEWLLKNGSSAIAFPTGRGDSYTLTFALIDEADLADNLEKTMNAILPTIDAGGRLFLISKIVKAKQDTYFKKIVKGAEDGRNGWFRVFLGWMVRPERTQQWYESICTEALETVGHLDNVHENYPATLDEALRAPSFDKRFHHTWIDKCRGSLAPLGAKELREAGAPAVNGLKVYRLPEPGRSYRAGADTAEGNPQSDLSSLTIVDRETWEEVAKLSARLEPEAFAGEIVKICSFFNKAPVLVERNNHGHAVLQALRGKGITRLDDANDKKPGHLTSPRSKTMMMDEAASILMAGDCTIHSPDTLAQLSSIEGSTLSAPGGQHDDEAISLILALLAAKRPKSQAL